MSNAWVGVIGALGGVAITGLIALVTALLNHRWSVRASYEDRQADLRITRAALRRTAYARCLGAFYNMCDSVFAGWAASDPPENWSLASWYGENPEQLRDAQIAGTEARLVAGDAVLSRLEKHAEDVRNYVNAFDRSSHPADASAYLEAQKELVTAMREEQAIDLGR